MQWGHHWSEIGCSQCWLRCSLDISFWPSIWRGFAFFHNFRFWFALWLCPFFSQLFLRFAFAFAGFWTFDLPFGCRTHSQLWHSQLWHCSFDTFCHFKFMIHKFFAFFANFIHSCIWNLTSTTFVRHWWLRLGARSRLTRHGSFRLQNDCSRLCVSEAVCLFKNVSFYAFNLFSWSTPASWAHNWSRSLRLFGWFERCGPAERFFALCLRFTFILFATLAPLAREVFVFLRFVWGVFAWALAAAWLCFGVRAPFWSCFRFRRRIVPRISKAVVPLPACRVWSALTHRTLAASLLYLCYHTFHPQIFPFALSGFNERSSHIFEILGEVKHKAIKLRESTSVFGLFSWARVQEFCLQLMSFY